MNFTIKSLFKQWDMTSSWELSWRARKATALQHASEHWTRSRWAQRAEQRGDRCRDRIEAEEDKAFRGGMFILACNCKLWGFCLFYPFRITISKTKFKVTALLMHLSPNLPRWATGYSSHSTKPITTTNHLLSPEAMKKCPKLKPRTNTEKEKCETGYYTPHTSLTHTSAVRVSW